MYIAYEYVPGRTLRHALDHGELDDERAVEAAAQILEGLAHAHAARDRPPRHQAVERAARGRSGHLRQAARLRARPGDRGGDPDRRGRRARDARVHLAGAAARKARRAVDRRVVDRRPALGGARAPPPVRRGPVPRRREEDRARRAVARERAARPAASRSSELVDRALAVDPASDRRPRGSPQTSAARCTRRDRRPPGACPCAPPCRPRFRRSCAAVGPAVPRGPARRLDDREPGVLPRLLAGGTRRRRGAADVPRPSARAGVRPRRARAAAREHRPRALRSPTGSPPARGSRSSGPSRAPACSSSRGRCWLRSARSAWSRWPRCPLGIPGAAPPSRSPPCSAPAIVAALGGHHLPLAGGDAADLSIGGIADPLGAASALWNGAGRVACVPARNDRARGGGGGRRSLPPPRSLGRRAVRRAAAHADAPGRTRARPRCRSSPPPG